MALSDELSKLAELHANGCLSDEEFRRAKERLLNGRASGNPADSGVSALNSFRRSRTDRWLAGVCGGIGRATGVESWVWRLVFVLLFVWGGIGLFLYLLLWIFVPSD